MGRIGGVSNVLIVNENLRDFKLRDRHHARRLTELVPGAEPTDPEKGIEAAPNDPTADLILDALQSGPTSEVFFKSEAFVVGDDVVMREDHEAGGEIDAAVMVSRDHDFLEEDLHFFPPAANLGYIDGIKAFVESSQVNPVHDPCWRIHTSRIHGAVFNDAMDRVFAIINVHLKDT